MFTYGPYTASSFIAPAAPLKIALGTQKNIAYARVINNSPYLLNIDLGPQGQITMAEMYQEDIPLCANVFGGTITITPTVNLSNTSQAISNIISVNTYRAGELLTPQSQPLTQQAVHATSSGKPIFTATNGIGVSATGNQYLNIFNPANSKVTYIFHSFKAFTSDSSLPICYLYLVNGADLNLATAVNAVSHDGTLSSRASTSHVTWADSNSVVFSSTAILEAKNIAANTDTEFMVFPDNYSLSPGNNLTLQVASGVSGKTVRMTAKWTETQTF